MKDLWIGARASTCGYMKEIARTRSGTAGRTRSACPWSAVRHRRLPRLRQDAVTTVSPLTSIIIDSNVGGHFRPVPEVRRLRRPGHRGQGLRRDHARPRRQQGAQSRSRRARSRASTPRADRGVDAHVRRRQRDRRNIALVTTGRAADHVRMGMLNFSFWDWRRGVPRLKQAGRVGSAGSSATSGSRPWWPRTATHPALARGREQGRALTTPKKVSVCTCQSEVDEITAIIRRWSSDPSTSSR